MHASLCNVWLKSTLHPPQKHNTDLLESTDLEKINTFVLFVSLPFHQRKVDTGDAGMVTLQVTGWEKN